MPNDEKQPRKELKVTDKRIFTAEGEIREEFRGEIKPADVQQQAQAPAAAPEAPAEKPVEKPAEKPAEKAKPPKEERNRSKEEMATNPGSAFTNFIEPLIAQAYMFLGMLRDPYQPQQKTDPRAARQMIDILTLLKEKTEGNLTADEDDFLTTHLSDLKLAYVQRTKSI